MTETWVPWEVIKDYEAILSDGRTVVCRGMYLIYAEDEARADACADVHLRYMLTLAGIPWGNQVESE